MSDHPLTFHTQHRAIRYVGSKIRLMTKLRPMLQSLGGKFLVDVFGGSGAVIMGSGFDKRVYNDVDADAVNFFKVLADRDLCNELFTILRRMPMSRAIFEELHAVYIANDKSFETFPPARRAAAFFYRSAFAFGGKIRNGGFAATLSDRVGCKEITRYRSVLRRMAQLRHFWQSTVIEQLDFEDCIKAYGNREGSVLFCDPPYFGTERHYSRKFPRKDHARLAQALSEVSAAVVVTYYDTPEIRALYPRDKWEHHLLVSTKNSMKSSDSKEKTHELILVRRFRAKTPSPLQARLRPTPILTP